MTVQDQTVEESKQSKTPVALVRERRKLRQIDVAKAVGCDKGHYSNIESGKQIPSPDLARRISRFFGAAVTEHQLLYPTDYMAADLPVSGAT